MINKKLVIALVTVITAGTATIGVRHILAADNPSNNNPTASLIQKLVRKFNLNESEVTAVFEADRTERQTARQTEMKQRNEARLSEAVSQGKITEAQKQLILQKQAEWEASRQSQSPIGFKNLSDAQREAEKTKRDTDRKALEDWATANGIDTKYLFDGFGHGERGGNLSGNQPSSTATNQ